MSRRQCFACRAWESHRPLRTVQLGMPQEQNLRECFGALPAEAAVCNRCRTMARRSATPVVDEPACQGAQLQTAPDQATTEIPSQASQEVRLQTPPERMRAVGPHQKASQRRNLASIRPPSESKGGLYFPV